MHVNCQSHSAAVQHTANFSCRSIEDRHQQTGCVMTHPTEPSTLERVLSALRSLLPRSEGATACPIITEKPQYNAK
eukprot:1755080-Amphidinium_carterae.1